MRSSRTQLWTCWLAPAEHTDLHWLSCHCDRAMAHLFRLWIKQRVAWERGERGACPTCGAALGHQNGVEVVHHRQDI